LTVDASLYGYEFNSTIIQIHVLRRPVRLTVNLNATIRNEIRIKLGETVLISLCFKDSLTNKGIVGANVTISWNPTYMGYTDADGNFTFIFNVTTAGDYEVHIRVEQEDYVLFEQTITIHVEEIGGFPWWLILLLLIVALLIVVFGVYRARRKKVMIPVAARKEPPKGRPTFVDLLKLKQMAIIHQPSKKLLFTHVIRPKKMSKEDERVFRESVPSLKESKLENRMISQKEMEILYHDGEFIRVAFQIEQRPSDDFFKSNIEFTKEFERVYQAELKVLPENMQIFQEVRTVELVNRLLNFELLLPHHVQKDRRLLHQLAPVEKRITKIALDQVKRTGYVGLVSLFEECSNLLKIADTELAHYIESFHYNSILLPESLLGELGKAQLLVEKKEVEDRIELDRRNRLKEQRAEAVKSANELLKQENYLDATTYYEKAAMASKELGEMGDYQKLTKKAEECLLYRVEKIEKQAKETGLYERKVPESPKKEERESAEKAVPSDANLKEKLKQLITQSMIDYVNITDAAQQLGISVIKVRDLAGILGYEVTTSRILKPKLEKAEGPIKAAESGKLVDVKEIEKPKTAVVPKKIEKPEEAEKPETIVTPKKIEKSEEAEEPETIGELKSEEVLEKQLESLIKKSGASYVNISDLTKEFGISSEKIRELAKQWGYRVTSTRIYKKKN
jgi:hypothetical protein